jgi:hypothetical protein
VRGVAGDVRGCDIVLRRLRTSHAVRGSKWIKPRNCQPKRLEKSFNRADKVTSVAVERAT